MEKLLKSRKKLNKNISFYLVFAFGLFYWFFPFIIKSVLTKKNSEEEKNVIKSWMEDEKQ